MQEVPISEVAEKIAGEASILLQPPIKDSHFGKLLKSVFGMFIWFYFQVYLAVLIRLDVVEKQADQLFQVDGKISRLEGNLI